MTESPSRLEVEDLQQNLRRVQERLAHKADPAALRGELDQLHPADLAYILEALPLEERQVVWDLVKAEREGEILLELSEAVRESLIATMDSKELSPRPKPWKPTRSRTWRRTCPKTWCRT